MDPAPKNFNPTPFKYHEELELDIRDLNNLGVGVGRIGNWVVMVQMALPGERVRARIYKNHKNFSEADLVEVIKPSPDRIKPGCPIFGECGGCQYQHLKYSAQLEWKRKQVGDLMRRIGKIAFPVEPTHASTLQYGYRSKLTPHYEKPRGESMPIGFIKRGRRNALVDVPQCPIASESINRALPLEREKLLARARDLRRGGTLLLRDSDGGVCSDNKAIISQHIGGICYKFCAGEFFQNNPGILPELISYVIGEASGSGAARYLVDAYCGVGVFAIAAASRFERAMGVEISPKAVECARENAIKNNIKNCEFISGSAEAIFKDASVKFECGKTAVVIDPPRAGCDCAFIEQLCDFSPKRLVYVSCAPDTQARDIALLIERGYTLKKLQPFDLFPQTRHIENVATLENSL